MVLIGAMGIFVSFYSFWLTGQFETVWLRKVTTALCGFMFAGALLWVGYGFQRGEIVYNRSVALPVWIIGSNQAATP